MFVKKLETSPASLGAGVLVFFLLSSFQSLVARAEVPRLVHFQGRLTNSAGAFVMGPATVQIEIIADATAPGPVLFTETQSGVSLNNGLFSILLGSQTGGGVPDSSLAGGDAWLQVTVDVGSGPITLLPRVRLATGPYAYRAGAAETLVEPGTASPAVSVAPGGRVGVGTTTPDPSARLDVSSTDGGLLPPRMTAAQRDAVVNPAAGLLIFNTDTACIDMWTGTTWKQACFDCTFQPPVAGNSGPICEGQTLQLTATTVSGATYQWTGPNGFSSTDQNPSLSNATPAATGPYSVTATASGCTSNPVTTLATVNPIPAAAIVASNSPLCAGQTLQLTSNAVPGANYAWTGPNGFTSSAQNPIIANATAAASGTYALVLTVNGCNSPPAQTAVAVSAIPDPPASIDGLATVTCNQTGVVYSVDDVTGATSYAWTVPAGASIANGQGTAFLTVSFGGQGGQITVTASNACGTSGPTALTVTMGAPPGSQTFTPSGSGLSGTIQSFTVPACVSQLTIEAWGAQGGSAPGFAGGLGARMRGVFSVTAGQTLRVLVGQLGGGSQSSGGGGGSFVATTDNSPLIVAGAGGGGRSNDGSGNGAGGVIATAGTAAAYPGGTNGNGGQRDGGGTGGFAGGGFYTDGQQGSGPGQSGFAFVNGGAGGLRMDNGANLCADGGFGGGGGGMHNNNQGSGGGGGYSGGGAGYNVSGLGWGGGGGSFNAGSNQSNSTGARTGDGLVVFTW